MQSWLRYALQNFRWRLTPTHKFPKADLLACLLNVAGRGFEPHTVLDIGANRAKWSRRIKTVFPDCQVLMVEPQEEMKPYLDRFCRRHRHTRWIQAGCGDQVGELPFTVRPDTVSSSFATPEDKAARNGWERRMVPVYTVDHLIEHELQGKVPDLVKIDAEGFEDKILDGASRLFGHTELIFLEAHFFGQPQDPNGLMELSRKMDQLGYAVYDFTWFGRRPYDRALGLCEVAFARQAGILRAFRGWNKAA